LDELIDSAMSAILGKLEAGFDPSAGLSDIYARCSAARHASHRPGHRTVGEGR
jgi:hypothetical protein